MMNQNIFGSYPNEDQVKFKDATKVDVRRKFMDDEINAI